MGYGFRLVMNPPFQAAQLGRDDTMIVAWWDVNADGAGQHGRVGLYNVTLVPGEGPGTGSFEPVPVDRNGEPHVVLRRGEGGPEVRLPSQVNGLGGLGTLTAGPADRAWSVEIEGGPTLSWPEAREMLHSWDPEDGGPARFQRMPVQPWGPWKTPPDAPSEP